MQPISAPWTAAALLAEQLVPVPEPFTLALRPGAPGTPANVVARAARALLDLPEVAPQPPSWLEPHQVPALTRLCGVMHHYGGALLADAVGLGKSYVALAVALELRAPFTLVVPAVLIPQWRRLMEEKAVEASVITHESLSRSPKPMSRVPFSRSPGLAPGVGKAKAAPLVIVDEAHRFRNPDTLRYRRLAELCVGSRVLLITATPVHNRIADLFHLFRLFLRDDALTALGVGSLIRAARGELDAAQVGAVAARLIVARSRARASDRVSFPGRGPATTIGAASAPDDVLSSLVQGIGELRLGGRAAALLRLTLLRRLASSMPAFRATVERYRAFVDLATEAALMGRRLETADFQRLFPRDGASEIQLTLLPLVLHEGATVQWDRDGLARLRDLAHATEDPKAGALEQLLASRSGKTIVFTDAIETARYLLRRLSRRFRVAAVSGTSGWFGTTRATTQEVLAAFAPEAQGAPAPPPSLATDVLIATDLVSEGLNLQDAERVIHYDLPWSPARLAQRVGRIDRLGSPHARIDTVAFAPPAVLGEALRIERRLAAKLVTQREAGAAQRESTSGPDLGEAPLDWCDRLQSLAGEGDGVLAALTPGRGPGVSTPGWAQVRSQREAAVLIVRLGSYVEAFFVEGGEARAAPEAATALLEQAVGERGIETDSKRLDAALRLAAPVIRARLRALEAARWRAEDRDRLGRRLIPWVLTAARRASRAGDAPLLGRLDHLVTRLTLGMTAGEESSLRALVERRASLSVRDLLAWHERLPAVTPPPDAPEIELVAVVVFSP